MFSALLPNNLPCASSHLDTVKHVFAWGLIFEGSWSNVISKQLKGPERPPQLKKSITFQCDINVFCFSEQFRVLLLLNPGGGLAEFLIYETHTRFIKTLKDLIHYIRTLNLGRLLIKVPAIFHPPHPTHLLKEH